MDGSLLRLDNATDARSDQGVALDHLRLGWRPIVTRDRRVLGVRIEIRPAPNTAESLTSTVGAVIAALADQTTSSSRGIVVTRADATFTEHRIAGDRRMGQQSQRDCLKFGAEVMTPKHLPLIEAAHQGGLRFVLRQSKHPLPRDTQRLFTAVVDDSESGRSHDGASALWVRDVHTRSDVESAFGTRRAGDDRLAA